MKKLGLWTILLLLVTMVLPAPANADSLPTAPTNLTVQANTIGQIDLSWTDNSNDETGFKIERKSTGEGYIQIATVAANVTSYSSTGLANNTVYYYRVRSYNGSGDSGYSNEANTTTLSTVPAAPSVLIATAASSSGINLTWQDNSNNETSFKIERKSTGESYIQIDTVGANVTSYSSSGLASGTNYSYRVRASNAAGDSNYSNEANATTTTNTPAAPSGLAATVASSSSINLTWTDNSSNETGFKIEFKPSSGSYSQIGTVGANITSYTSTGLASSTTYYYRVLAYNGSGNSSYSNEANAATTATTPAAPSDLTATTASTSSINLTWTDNSSNETGFMIERAPVDGSYSQIDAVGANITSYTSTGLANNTYYYRVRAYNGSGNSNYSNVVYATTGTVGLAAPSGLTATINTSSSIYLDWSDNSSNETGFMIERSTDNSNFYQITTVGANISYYTNTGLSTNTYYYYRVRAYNSSGSSDYSNVAYATTGSSSLNAPSNLVANTASSSGIYLSWYDNSSNETGFMIERSTEDSSYYQIATVGANITYYTDTSLSNNTTYYYRVRAYNNSGASNYSNTYSATTGSSNNSLNAPSNLVATTASSSSIYLSWYDNSSNETGFMIERSTSGGSYSQITTVGAHVTTYTDTDLANNTTYYYQVRAYNGSGGSNYSNSANATTSSTNLSAPSYLTATASASSINLTWTDNSSSETGFMIERKTSGDSYSRIVTVGANVTSYTNSGLANNTTYYYRVQAYNNNDESDYSNEYSATTGSSNLEAPSNLIATASSSGIYLTWTDNSSNESGFKIERKTEGGSYSQITAVSSNVTSYTSTGLNSDTRYYYRVQAFNDDETTEYSNEASAVPVQTQAQTVIQLSIGKTGFLVNNELSKMDTAPIIKDSRTFIPIRYIAESLGATVNWSSTDKKVTITSPENTIELWVGKNTARVNNKNKTIDTNNNVVPIIVPPGRTMLPLRFVAESLGCQVEWDPDTKQVTISGA